MSGRAVELLRSHPRLFWGKVIEVFISQGWNPPVPSARVADKIIDSMGETDHEATLALSPRQRTLLEMLAEGKEYVEIERELGVSHYTLRYHQKELYARLGARNNAHAVCLGFRLGILK